MKTDLFKGKIVLIIGASGGLGSAIVRAFSAQGAVLVLASRRELLPADTAGLQQFTTCRADLSDPASLQALRDQALAAHGRVDIVINACGYDARKSLADHSLEDFRRSVDANLLGAMLLTQTFLPVMQSGVILHLGGFADGRLAFPFYSADVATRAGLRAFTESVNRELSLARQPVVVSFFSPSPADTAAERPFHSLWRQMGTPVVPVETVAAELLKAVLQRRKVYIMGGPLTRAFAGLNAVWPRFADVLVMNQYGAILKRYFEAGEQAVPTPGQKRSFWQIAGILLVIFSFIAYGFLLALPFLPLSIAQKAWLAPVFIAVGEISFWVGGALLGKQIVERYKRYLNPCNWLR